VCVCVGGGSADPLVLIFPRILPTDIYPHPCKEAQVQAITTIHFMVVWSIGPHQKCYKYPLPPQSQFMTTTEELHIYISYKANPHNQFYLIPHRSTSSTNLNRLISYCKPKTCPSVDGYSCLLPTNNTHWVSHNSFASLHCLFSTTLYCIPSPTRWDVIEANLSSYMVYIYPLSTIWDSKWSLHSSVLATSMIVSIINTKLYVLLWLYHGTRAVPEFF
jgi:hypothetical protein